MKWITIPINLPDFRDLVQQALDYLRKNLVTVNSFSDRKEKKKPLDRDIPRPWTILPSIQGFKIELSPNDWLLTLFGLKKRFPNKMEFTTWHNDDSNDYIDYMFKRLRKQVEMAKYHEAADTMWILMGSSAYQGSALNHVLHNWHRNLSTKHVKKVMKEVKRLVKSRATNLKYARVYLQEATKIRPLGVPTMSWRIYLHMYNNLLVEWRSVTESNKQHGYLPGKGVITAWRGLMLLLNEPNIYEADFKNFFGSVQHRGLEIELQKIGMPMREIHFLHDINKSQPKLTPEDQIDEFRTRQYNYIAKCINEEQSPTGIYWAPLEQNIVDAFGTADPLKSELLLDCIAENLELTSYDPKRRSLYLLKFMEMQWALLSSLSTNLSGFHNLLQGVPQGAPTSCSLATLALRWLERQYKIIIYADDVIYCPKSADSDPVKDLNNELYGIELNEKKSRWAKRNGVWLVDSIKFLGIRYYPNRYIKVNLYDIAELVLQGIRTWGTYKIPSKFVAETRKGANLEFSNKESLLSYLAIARELLLDSKYLKGKMKTYSLTKWLLTREAKWLLLSNKSKMLFGRAVQMMAPLSRELHFVSERVVKAYPNAIMQITENPLTGYFLSRMQSNTWEISNKQNFALTYKEGSWVDGEWNRYSWQYIITRERINTFTASSFAIHDLINWLSYKSRKRKSIIRRVVTRAKRLSWYEEAIKLRSEIRKEPFYNNPSWNNWELPQLSKEISINSSLASLVPVIGVDLIIGFPIFSLLYILTGSRIKIILKL